MPEMPGWISEAHREEMSTLSGQLQVRSKYPFPLAQKGKRGNKFKIHDAKHALVDALYGHIERYRSLKSSLKRSPATHSKYSLHELVKEMIQLPPLKTGTANQWHKTGLKILKDATENHLLGHSAFKAGGRYAALKELNGKGDSLLPTRLLEAWKIRAREMERISAATL